MEYRVWRLALAIGLTLSTTGCMSVVEIPDDLVLLELHAPPPEDKSGWMHVVLGSTFDYQKYVVENNLDVGVDVAFCGKEKYDAHLADINIYSNYDNHHIFSYTKYSEMKKDRYYRYDIFINAIRPKGWYKGFGTKPNEVDEINFLTMPEDVCINFIDFASMVLGTRSNVVRIPKERLAEEMAHPTPGGKLYDPLRGGIIK